MQYLKFIVFSCLIILLSCSSDTNSQSDVRTFYVEREALDKGKLRIHLPDEIPKNLAIQTPDGEWFVLQDHEASIEVMPQSRFESLKIMEFQIERLKGTTWRESKKLIELIFKTSGNYLIYFADNLETEPENTFSLQERVNYKNNTRKQGRTKLSD